MRKQMKMNTKKQQGFTLIELVIVIVILGILAASALPKFVDLSEDARKASIEGLAGSVRSASAMAHAKAIVSKQNGATGSISVEGTAINMINGYPSAASLMDLIADTSGYTVTSGTGEVTIDNGAATTASCDVVYTDAVAGNAPSIALTTSDCS